MHSKSGSFLPRHARSSLRAAIGPRSGGVASPSNPQHGRPSAIQSAGDVPAEVIAYASYVYSQMTKPRRRIADVEVTLRVFHPPGLPRKCRFNSKFEQEPSLGRENICDVVVLGSNPVFTAAIDTSVLRV